MTHQLRSILSAACLCAALAGCTGDSPKEPTVEELKKEVLGNQSPAAKKKLAGMETEKAARTQLELAEHYDRKGDLAEACYWLRCAIKHGSKPPVIRTSPHTLYLHIRTKDRDSGETLLAYCKGSEAGAWQSLVGDDYELDSISRAEKWWDLAAENGYKGTRNKHEAAYAWMYRNWLYVLLASAAGGAAFLVMRRRSMLRGRNAEITGGFPEPPVPQEHTKSTPGSGKTITVSLTQRPGPYAKPVTPAPRQ